jgi:hypothetical protein
VHVVTTPSQVMETPDTLLQVVAVQLKKAFEHDVLHIADASADDIKPGDAASVNTAKRQLRIRSFRILFLLFVGLQTVHEYTPILLRCRAGLWSGRANTVESTRP